MWCSPMAASCRLRPDNSIWGWPASRRSAPMLRHTSAMCSSFHRLSPSRSPASWPARWRSSWRGPDLPPPGIYLALATFALGQIVQAIILNLEVVGGAAGYPVAAFIRLPTIAATAAIVVALVWLLFATRFGIAVTAVHDDEGAADLMG